MRKCLLRAGMSLLILGCILLDGVAGAATMYVTDTFEITMRATPGVGKKIVAMLPSNTRVRTEQKQDGWVLVTTESGRKGWVLERYLTSDTPSAFLVKGLTENNESLKQSLQNATAELDQLKASQGELTGSLTRSEDELADLKQAYESLKKEAAGVLELKRRHEAVTAELAGASETISGLRRENEILRSKERYRWFFSGGGMVLLTLLIGFWFGRIRRRQTSRLSL